MANCLKALGAAKGDRVTLYMPMIPEAAVAMLACARIGAVHSVVFGGFSPEALHGRIEDCASRFVVTADGGMRGGKLVPLKANVDAALGRDATGVEAVIVVRHLGEPVEMQRRPRPLVRLAGRGGAGQLPLRADERRGSAVHPLHVGLDRQAQGRAAHDRRLCGVDRDHLPLCLRLPARRDLLVHRRRRLGHRPLLRRLRAARQRRDQPDVRGRAQLSRQQPLLGRRRAPQGQHLLHRADRDPRADARGRRAGEEARPLLDPPARHGRRADQPRGLALVLARASARRDARSSTPGGRPRPAAS